MLADFRLLLSVVVVAAFCWSLDTLLWLLWLLLVTGTRTGIGKFLLLGLRNE